MWLSDWFNCQCQTAQLVVHLTSNSEDLGSNWKTSEWVLRVLAKIPYTRTTNFWEHSWAPALLNMPLIWSVITSPIPLQENTLVHDQFIFTFHSLGSRPCKRVKLSSSSISSLSLSSLLLLCREWWERECLWRLRNRSASNHRPADSKLTFTGAVFENNFWAVRFNNVYF